MQPPLPRPDEGGGGAAGGLDIVGIASVLRAVTRGLNQSIAEVLLIESEQFARMAPTADLRERLDAWMARRDPHYPGSWSFKATGRSS